MPRQFTTPVLLDRPPTDPSQAATKAYVDGAVGSAGDLPEATTTATAAVASIDLLGKTTRFDTSSGAIAQPLPAATAGRQVRVGWDAGTSALTLAAAAGDVIGAGSATSIPVPSNRSIVELRCSAGGRWRVVGGYLEPEVLDARYLGTRRAVSIDTTVVAGETLSVSAANGNRVLGQPVTAPPAGQRTFVEKSDNSSNTVLLNWTINDDTTGVRLNSKGAGVTLIVNADGGYRIESQTPFGVSRGAGGSGGAASSAPAVAGARPGFYDPGRNLYVPNAAAMRGLRGAMARAATGALVDVVCAGDSRTAGYGQLDAKLSWPNYLRAMLVAEGIPSAGTGLVMANNGVGMSDSRLTFAGTWTTSSPPNRTWGASGSTATFVSDSPGTIVEVWYRLGSGAFTVSIDGATAVTVTPAGGTGLAVRQFTGQTNANHTVKVTTTSSAGNLIGFIVRNATGVHVHSVAITQWTTTQWAATGVNTIQEVASFIAPSVFGLMLGCNDPTASIPVATTAANLATILATNNPGPTKFLINETPSEATKSSWPPYVSALYDDADQYGLPLFDLNDRFGGGLAGTAAGLLGADNLHETVAGANDIARGVTRLLTV